MIIDCISDLHGHYPELDGGDLLIIAGDLTKSDTPRQLFEFGTWLARKEYKRKIVIAGNHDNLVQMSPAILDGMPDAVFTYLCDSGTEFEGLKIWGSPWTPWFHGVNPKCKAFMASERALAKKWALIPDDTDILITHAPPHGCYLDQNTRGDMLGSVSLRDRIWQLKLKLHVFGHIHEGYGFHPTIGQPDCVNASHVNERYEPVNKPIRILL